MLLDGFFPKPLFSGADSGGGGGSAAPPSGGSAPASSTPSSPSAPSSTPAPAAPGGPTATPDSRHAEPSGAAGDEFDLESIFDELAGSPESTPPSAPVSGVPVATPPATPQAVPGQPPAPAAVAQPATPAPAAPPAATSPTGPQEPGAPSPRPVLDPGDPVSIARAVEENRDAHIAHVAQTRFKLTDKDLEALEQDLSTAIPNLLARVFVDTQINMLTQLGRVVPQMFQRHTSDVKRHETNETTFYKQWPQLDKAKHGELVNMYGATYRQMNPNATLEQMIAHLGPMVMMAAGVTPNFNGAPPAPSPAANPMQPALPGVRPPPATPFTPATPGAVDTAHAQVAPDGWNWISGQDE